MDCPRCSSTMRKTELSELKEQLEISFTCQNNCSQYHAPWIKILAPKDKFWIFETISYSLLVDEYLINGNKHNNYTTISKLSNYKNYSILDSLSIKKESLVHNKWMHSQLLIATNFYSLPADKDLAIKALSFIENLLFLS